MSKYRKRPVVIEAVEFKGFNKENGSVMFDITPTWLTDEFGQNIVFFDEEDTLTIKTLEGDHTARIGDYIIRGVHGELYPCKPEIFHKTYEKVSE